MSPDRLPRPLLLASLLLATLPLALALPACGALQAAPAEDVLAAGAGAAAVDAAARRALAAADAAPADVDKALAATRALFVAADLRLQRAQLRWLDAHPAADLAAVVAADDALQGEPDGAEVCAEILALCTDGVEAADRAAAARPDSVDAQLHRGLHLSLVAWANGPMRSLFAGYGSRLVEAIGAAVRLDPMFDAGAPLRLQGRFRGKAPWPYGDLDLAQRSLQRAVEAHPVVVNLLFLGDVRFAAGDRDAARAAWQRATTAAADPATTASAELLREQARRRLGAQ